VIAEQVQHLEFALAERTKALAELQDAVSALPCAPAGFGNSYVDRVAWTVRFVKDNWAVRQECEELKQRALRSERAVNACLLARESVPA
jgi:hypothetical protein